VSEDLRPNGSQPVRRGDPRGSNLVPVQGKTQASDAPPAPHAIRRDVLTERSGAWRGTSPPRWWIPRQHCLARRKPNGRRSSAIPDEPGGAATRHAGDTGAAARLQDLQRLGDEPRSTVVGNLVMSWQPPPSALRSWESPPPGRSGTITPGTDAIRRPLSSRNRPAGLSSGAKRRRCESCSAC